MVRNIFLVAISSIYLHGCGIDSAFINEGFSTLGTYASGGCVDGLTTKCSDVQKMKDRLAEKERNNEIKRKATADARRARQAEIASAASASRSPASTTSSREKKGKTYGHCIGFDKDGGGGLDFITNSCNVTLLASWKTQKDNSWNTQFPLKPQGRSTITNVDGEGSIQIQACEYPNLIRRTGNRYSCIE